MVLISTLSEIFPNPTVMEVVGRLVMFLARIWIGIIVGVLVGWVWKPKWAKLGRDCLNSPSSKEFTAAPTSSSVFSSFNSFKLHLPSYKSWISSGGFEEEVLNSSPPAISTSSSSVVKAENSSFVSEEDLDYIIKLVEEKDGGPAWIQMMDRSTSNMNYRAWRRDLKTGPPQYRSRSIYEDANPEMVRDFFWDDEFRMKWDDMLVEAETLEECPTTGTMVLRWVRKFPFFCNDREYIIGRRIWESGRSYYCVTKGVKYSSVPRHNKPKRVDLYYSSWRIRAVESSKGDGRLNACEVLLFHYEDMGIPWEIAKLGVRRGMWGAVKNIDKGFRLFQKEKASGAPQSRYALMARVNTKVNQDYLKCIKDETDSSEEVERAEPCRKPEGKNMPKLLVLGGVLVLACSLDRGLLTKAVIFGIARKFANIGRRL